VSVVSTSAAPGGAAGTTSVVALDHGGRTRTYRLFVPTSLPAGPRPLLMGLHGYRSDAATFESGTRLDAGAVKAGAIAVYPDGVGKSWNAGRCCGTASATGVDDVGFLTAVVQDVAAGRSVDGNRVSVVGMSNGGMMAYRLGCERSDLFGVVEVMTGTFVGPTCSFTRPVSLLHVHGALDDVVPLKGTATTPLANGGFPAVMGPVSAYSTFDRCSGSTTGPYGPTRVATLWQASACPAGTYVQLVTSSTMGHRWSTGATDLATYGVDMTGMTWGFNGGVWAGRGAPTAL
jgi:polyhydroxybutyrate depolymerase